MQAASTTDALADLTQLATAMTERGYTTQLHTSPGKLPCLDLRNPRAADAK